MSFALLAILAFICLLTLTIVLVSNRSTERFYEEKPGFFKRVSNAILGTSVKKTTTAKPVSKSVGKPVSKSTGKPVSKPAGKPVSNPVGKPVSNPVGKPVSNPVGKPVSNPVGKPVSKPVSKPAGKPVSNPVGKLVSNPVPKPVFTTAFPSNLTYEQARDQYLKENPDVKNAGVDPWDHYVNNGQGEGRQWRGAHKPAFPSNLTYEQARDQYLKENPDVKNAGVDPWDHYVNNGQGEGRQWRGAHKPAFPSNLTYEQARDQYLKENPDVKNAGVDPWDHYVNNGQGEGRQWRGAHKPPAPQPQPNDNGNWERASITFYNAGDYYIGDPATSCAYNYSSEGQRNTGSTVRVRNTFDNWDSQYTMGAISENHYEKSGNGFYKGGACGKCYEIELDGGTNAHEWGDYGRNKRFKIKVGDVCPGYDPTTGYNNAICDIRPGQTNSKGATIHFDLERSTLPYDFPGKDSMNLMPTGIGTGRAKSIPC